MQLLTKNELKKELETQYEMVWGKDTHMQKWAIKNDCIALKFDDGMIYTIAKPSIETSFCFGYGYCGISNEEDRQSASDSKHYADTHKDYFINENTEKFDRYIKDIEECINSEYDYVYISKAYHSQTDECKLVNINFTNSFHLEQDTRDYKLIRRLTDEELIKLKGMYEQAKEMLMKRLQTYLKRYGLSKLHTWTYLVD